MAGINSRVVVQQKKSNEQQHLNASALQGTH
jgi:hypothetical protein